ncbi:ABC transporter substrate-binding protein [Pseudaminobacter sp. 19-2017]|uniref:ABC transporter substrate-binding protein n=2 Tax=Pseudaminobacter soli (ex Zhang et al. 2022) TaxID=2831468 RepID=A0A942DXS4_9HYPH|nr:ABC transporter substrate-binding protein [Pseudaminobacter soli]
MSRRALLVGTLALSAAHLPLQTLSAAELDVLTLGKAGDPDNIDPAVTGTNNSFTITYPAYERLVKYNGSASDVIGELAESWEASPDAMVWTFKIAKGHTFSDGTPVTAEAVKFSFERVVKVAKSQAKQFTQITKMELVDADTIRFTLENPSATFLSLLAGSGASIVNPAVMQHEVDGDMGQAYLADHTMGSGAYQVASWEKGQQIVLEANPHYAGKADLKKVVVRIIKDASARRLQLEKGDLDLVEDLPSDQLESLAGAEGVAIVDEPGFFVTYLYLNNKSAPLDNLKVRQAISYAMDYQGIIDGVLHGKAKQMRGAVPSGMWSHDETVKQYTYDPEKAKALLAEAGVSDAKLGYLYAKTDPNWEVTGLVLQQALAPLGITLEMQENDYPTMRDRIDKGNFDIAVGNWSPDLSDPSEFVKWWFDSKYHGLPGNRAFYSNPEVDQLIRDADVISDQAAREQAYKKVQAITAEEAPYVMLFQRNFQFAMRSNVEGYVYNPMLVQMYNFADMKKN